MFLSEKAGVQSAASPRGDSAISSNFEAALTICIMPLLLRIQTLSSAMIGDA